MTEPEVPNATFDWNCTCGVTGRGRRALDAHTAPTEAHPAGMFVQWWEGDEGESPTTEVP